MTKQSTFYLKDIDPALIDVSGVTPQGRKYDKAYKDQPGAIQIEDVLLGMEYAELAITDEKSDTVAKVAKSNPWHIEALKIICNNNEEEVYKPLSYILSKYMGLTLDKIIDINGISPGGHMLDTQGYIAHNKKSIVLSFRCTTSFKDWLTNFNTTSSQWEIEEDLAQGFSGYCSGLEGLCCFGDYTPRVHTGFYNNFLASLPIIKKYIEPMIKPDQPSRTLYIVGHSLGAGIATLATCYFLLEHDWTQLPHKIVSVTAGSPRSCQGSMKTIIDEKMKELRPLDKAVLCRVVLDKDVVPAVPPALFGFVHIGKLVFITDKGEILINPKLDDPKVDINKIESESREDEEFVTSNSKYNETVAKIPKPFRDHMPDLYLYPLLKKYRKEHGTKLQPTMSENFVSQQGSFDDACIVTTTKSNKTTLKSVKKGIHRVFTKKLRCTSRFS